jgi:hypothetical protein
MKTVLLITYHFPPRNSIGGLRMQGLAKFLPEFGWTPIVLTPKLPGHADAMIRVVETPYYDIADLPSRLLKSNDEEGLLVLIKKKLHFKNGEKKSIPLDIIFNLIEESVAFPDQQKGWYNYAAKAGIQLFESEKIDAIISSSKPETCHSIARALKSKYKVPWIADLRDLWTQNHYYNYSILRKFRERKLELDTLGESEALVTVSRPLAETLGQFHKSSQVYSIPNGFDPNLINSSPNSNLTQKFTITYTGQLYKGKRDPSKLFKSIANLISDNIINKEKIEIRFYSPKEEWMIEEIENYGLHGIANWYGFVPRDISLRKQRESQLLLILLWDRPEEIGVYTGKVFEYLAAKGPILCIGGPKGSVIEELFLDTEIGVYLTDLDDIENYIKRCYLEFINKGYLVYESNERNLDKYSQKEMARKFSLILNELTDSVKISNSKRRHARL